LPILVGARPTITISASKDTICAGTMVHFTALVSGASSPHYEWKINGALAGTDTTVNATDSLENGDTIICLLTNTTGDTVFATSNSIIMTVHPLPFAGTITGPDTSVCVGATITLTDTVPGGVWGDEYGYATVVGGVVTGFSGGIEESPSFDIIYYAISNLCGTDSANKPITIFPLPDPSFYIGDPIGGASLCVGQTYYINGGDGINGGNGFIYSLNGYISYIDDNTVYKIGCNVVGLDMLISVAKNSCGSDTAKQVIMIQVPPDTAAILTTSNAICVGDTITLIDSNADGLLEWHTSNNNATISIYNGFMKGILPGLDTVSLNVSNGCGSTNSSIVITINQTPPISGVDSVCKGFTIPLSDSMSGGIWSSNNANIAAIDPSTGIVSGIGDGVAVITYTIPSGCFDTASVRVNTCAHEVVIYPSPSDGELVIHAYVDIYQSCTLINSIGQIVMRQSLTGTFTNIDVSLLAAGMYFVKLEGNGNEFVGKFVKD